MDALIHRESMAVLHPHIGRKKDKFNQFLQSDLQMESLSAILQAQGPSDLKLGYQKATLKSQENDSRCTSSS